MSIYIPNFIEIGKTLCGRTYGRTYLLMDIYRPPLMLLGQLKRSRPKNEVVWGSYGSFTVTGTETIQQSKYDFLYTFHSNCAPIL